MHELRKLDVSQRLDIRITELWYICKIGLLAKINSIRGNTQQGGK